MSDPPPNERTQRVARNLNLHFDADGRYYSEGYVGSGEHADVFLMRKRRKETTGPERVVVKVLRRWEGEEEEEQWDHYEQLTEKDALEVSGCSTLANL